MSIAFHVYGNGGSGPIDYTTPIATTSSLAWTSGELAAGAMWKFGVRAFDTVSGLEEQNLDAAAVITLDAGGLDVSNRPAPPNALRAFPVVTL